jgi:hypothetical protein
MREKDGVRCEKAEDAGRIPCEPCESVCFVDRPQAARIGGVVLPRDAGPTGEAQ